MDDVPVVLDTAEPPTGHRRMERDMLLNVDLATISAASAATLTGKLLQLCGGTVYTDDPRRRPGTRVQDRGTAELIEGLNGQQALLFYGYRHDIPRIVKAVSEVDGRLRIKQYDGQADAGRLEPGEIDVLLAQPASCAYGLNCSRWASRDLVWADLEPGVYQQANARLYRQGQEHPVVIHRLLVKDGMDEQVAEALEGKRGHSGRADDRAAGACGKNTEGAELMEPIMQYALELVAAERQRRTTSGANQSGNHPFEWMSNPGRGIRGAVRGGQREHASRRHTSSRSAAASRRSSARRFSGRRGHGHRRGRRAQAVGGMGCGAMRLIDADAFKQQGAVETVRQGLNVEKVALLLMLIDMQPTIGAAPVVRCRDCEKATLTMNDELKYCKFWQPDGGEACIFRAISICGEGARHGRRRPECVNLEGDA